MKVKPMIAFIGTDGSGKSTVIDAVTPKILDMGFEGVHYEHLRPHWLQPLGVLLGKREKDDDALVVDPHGEKPSGFMGSSIRLLYYYIDYTLGYYSKICPLMKSGKVLCLFDRYFYDVVIDPRRLRIKLPQFFIRGLFKFAPRPTIVICLGGDPKILYERKPETSLEEVTRQVGELKSLVEKQSGAYWVHTDQSLQQTIVDTMLIISKLKAN